MTTDALATLDRIDAVLADMSLLIDDPEGDGIGGYGVQLLRIVEARAKACRIALEYGGPGDEVEAYDHAVAEVAEMARLLEIS